MAKEWFLSEPSNRKYTPGCPPNASAGVGAGRMNLPEVFDVIVVGFGIAGATAAIHSLQRGASTLVIDAADVEQAGGNSLVAGQAFITRENRTVCGVPARLSVRLQDVNEWAELSARLPETMSSLGVSVDPVGIGGNYVGRPKG